LQRGKQVAAEAAAKLLLEKHLPSAERVGIGTGSTTRMVVEKLLELDPSSLRGRRLYASSRDTQLFLESLWLEASLYVPRAGVDVYFDGADEVSFEAGTCMLIKGRGAAMLREKMLAYNSRHVVIVVDEGKVSQRLGEKGKPLPVEVHPDAASAVVAALEALGLRASIRAGCGCRDGPACTDNGGVVVDVWGFNGYDLLRLESIVETIPGVYGSGAFAGYVDEVVVGYGDGRSVVKRCRRTRRNPALGSSSSARR
jgi:ribose 5-phosphate isomerase A